MIDRFFYVQKEISEYLKQGHDSEQQIPLYTLVLQNIITLKMFVY